MYILGHDEWMSDEMLSYGQMRISKYITILFPATKANFIIVKLQYAGNRVQFATQPTYGRFLYRVDSHV